MILKAHSTHCVAILSLFNQGFIKGEELGPIMKKIESQMGITNLLIENVLLWVRSQMAGVTISVEPVLLGNLVNEHLSLYETTAAGKKLQLVNEIHNELSVNADKHVLSLALRNLISNAIKYSFENGKIRISAHKIDGHVSLSISDNGTGMSESTLTRLLQQEALTSELGTETRWAPVWG